MSVTAIVCTVWCRAFRSGNASEGRPAGVFGYRPVVGGGMVEVVVGENGGPAGLVGGRDLFEGGIDGMARL